MKIGIVGLGYVGLPLGVAFAEAGHEVVGVDADARRVASVEAGESYVEDVSSERLRSLPPGLTRLSRSGRCRQQANRRSPWYSQSPFRRRSCR